MASTCASCLYRAQRPLAWSCRPSRWCCYNIGPRRRTETQRHRPVLLWCTAHSSAVLMPLPAIHHAAHDMQTGCFHHPVGEQQGLPTHRLRNRSAVQHLRWGCHFASTGHKVRARAPPRATSLPSPRSRGRSNQCWTCGSSIQHNRAPQNRPAAEAPLDSAQRRHRSNPCCGCR